MKYSLDEVRQLYTIERYGEALSVLNEIEKLEFQNPSILVWKARCLQLTEVPVVDLSEIEGLLKKAIVIDDEYLPALIDLGYFYLRVMDDAQKATPFFEKSINLCRDAATDGLVGFAECLAETKSPELATVFLAKNRKVELDSRKIERLIKELQ